LFSKHSEIKLKGGFPLVRLITGQNEKITAWACAVW